MPAWPATPPSELARDPRVEASEQGRRRCGGVGVDLDVGAGVVEVGDRAPGDVQGGQRVGGVGLDPHVRVRVDQGLQSGADLRDLPVHALHRGVDVDRGRQAPDPIHQPGHVGVRRATVGVDLELGV
jgi:hypothetical protein